ncbi:O-antigen ligase domain-containing protein, partial [Herbaspirillum sp. HC18]
MLIWGATSDWYWKTPWLGAGVSTARGLDPLDPAHRVNSPGLETAALNWHSHNVYLQVWFETGAVGALLLLSIGLLLLRAVWRSGPSDRPALLAAFASSGLMASTAFSIWAAWYLAAFGLVALFAVLAVT